MFQRILVPLDGSARAEEVLPLAARLARTSGASLFLLRVIPPPMDTLTYPVGPIVLPELQTEIEEALMQIASSELLRGICVRMKVLVGNPATLLMQLAQVQRMDLIVMRSHGATGFTRFVLGSVARQVARQSLVPVLVIRDGSSLIQPDSFMHPPRILVALDGASLAETALLPAAQLCAALAAPARGAIHLIRTVHRLSTVDDEPAERVDAMNEEAMAEAESYLRRIEQRFQKGDLASFHLTITTSVVTHDDAGDIWKRVIEECECIGDVIGYSACDIIAMTTHGRQGFQHLLEGSITERVLDATTHPLLVVHAHAAESKAAVATQSSHAQ